MLNNKACMKYNWISCIEDSVKVLIPVEDFGIRHLAFACVIFEDGKIACCMILLDQCVVPNAIYSGYQHEQLRVLGG